MERIAYEDLEAMLRNPDIPDDQIRPYLTVDPGAGGPFDPEVVPDPTLVEMDDAARFRLESAIRWGNAISRWRRQGRFRLRQGRGEMLPVIVSEGDSWFQFPFLIDDVVDQLGQDHLVWSLDAAGDTAQNMVVKQPEYLKGLRERRSDGVAAFMFSAAGNDIIGEDETGKPVLTQLLKQHDPDRGAAWHIDQSRLATILSFLESCYRKVVADIRSEEGFARLPIIVHGYDYAVPSGGPGDDRDPGWAERDEWLGGPMKAKGIDDPELRRAIVRFLIDALYDMLFKLAGNSAETRIYVVEVRGALARLGDWADEIHATSASFGNVADRFRATLREAGITSR